jgi:UDP-3-O-[3-hydroxymyristoyl] N-acetylglucosamine deacetylase
MHVRNHLVALGDTPCLNVVEHLFSALYGLQSFNVCVDVFGNQVPFFDGSSRDFVQALSSFEHQGFEVTRLRKRISIKKGESFIRYEPSEKLIIDMELFHPYIATQKIEIEIDREAYMKEIAPARTFAFIHDTDPRLKNLPAYGIGITHNKIYSREPLRFPDECVRHKILDLLGDLFVLKKPIAGVIISKNTSHQLNLQFVKEISTMLNT